MENEEYINSRVQNAAQVANHQAKQMALDEDQTKHYIVNAMNVERTNAINDMRETELRQANLNASIARENVTLEWMEQAKRVFTDQYNELDDRVSALEEKAVLS